MPDLLARVRSINYRSLAAVRDQVDRLQLVPDQFGPAVGKATALSPTKGYRLTRALLAGAADDDALQVRADNLLEWSLNHTRHEQETVIRAIRLHDGPAGDLHVINTAAAQPSQAAVDGLIAAYFRAGGDIGRITEWLRRVGQSLAQSKSGTAWNPIGAIVRGAKKVWKAAKKAGKAVADVVGDAASATVSAIKDVCRGLLEAGEQIGDILTEAARQGAAALKKFVRALVEVGEELGKLADWAIAQSTDLLKQTLGALDEIAGKVMEFYRYAASKTAAVLRRVTHALRQAGKSLRQVVTIAFDAAANLVSAAVKALRELGETAADLVQAVLTSPTNLFNAVVDALRRARATVAEPYAAVRNTVGTAVRKMTAALLAAGTALRDLADWAVDQTRETFRDFISAIKSIGRRIADLYEGLAATARSAFRRLTERLRDIGFAFATLVEELAAAGDQLVRRLVEELARAGRLALEYAAEVAAMTYRGARQLVDRLLAAGAAVGEVLSTTLRGGYLMYRRIVSGIIANSGPLAEILEWADEQATTFASRVYEQTLQSLRYAGRRLTDAVDWAIGKGRDTFTAIVYAWEAAEERLVDLYTYLKTVATAGNAVVWDWLGRATHLIKNSVRYTLLYLQRDFIPGIRKFVGGLLAAGMSVRDLISEMTDLATETATEVVRELLALAHTVSSLLVEGLRHPDRFLDKLQEALVAAGETYRELLDIARRKSAEARDRLIASLGRIADDLKDVVDAALEIGGGFVGVVIGLLLETLNTYRPMTQDEIAIARSVYGDSLDYPNIRFSHESFTNRVLFALSEKKGDVAAFVTMYLVNFNPAHPIDDTVMIHELCHVWQARHTGPFYMAEAIHEGIVNDDPYDYGYDDSPAGRSLGVGGEPELMQAMQNRTLSEAFDSFGREEQGRIMEHFYHRLAAQGTSNPPALQPWQDYANFVASAA